MSTYTLPNLTSGMDGSLVEIATTVPTFVPMFLLFIFIVVFMGGSSAQKRRTGTSDIPMWATLASLATLMMSLVLTIKEGLMNLTVLGIVIGITIVCGLWLFLDRNKNEI